MDNGQLMSHVDTDLVTRAQLALVPAPEPTATWRPIPHIELIETLDQVLRVNHIAIQEEQFALRRDGSTLFGVLQLAYDDTKDGRAAMGIRTSNDKKMSLQICAGLSVFVCDSAIRSVPKWYEQYREGQVEVPQTLITEYSIGCGESQLPTCK